MSNLVLRLLERLKDTGQPEHSHSMISVLVVRCVMYFIMQTCPCNVDPLTPHFYIVKLGFTVVDIISLFLL